ncbi:MAG TPA: SDR family NAD(P)-dependent oxidoreductase, partial [Acidimicrobiia bacterium]|nr:SDR family NAD(P)-dependent oxidoreductase [Acidimicrobiia bacterium]
MDLAGKVAIVTGASRGVGAATAELLAQRGCRVACAARATDESPLPIPGTIDDTVRRINALGGDAIAVPTNLARDDDVERMVATTLEHFGRVDALVNNAAITFPGDLGMEMKRFDLVMQVDLRA